MDYKKELVITSPLIFNIKKNVQAIFNIWISNARKDWPNIDIPRKDKKELFDDLVNAFSDAICSLEKENHKNKENIPGWSVGFIEGYVRSSINTHWFNDLIFKKTENYRKLLVLKSIILYMDFDMITTERIYKLFTYMFKESLNIEEKVENNENNIIQLIDYGLANNVELKAFWHFAKKYLEKELLDNYLFYLNENQKNHCPELSDFFSYDDIKGLTHELKERYSPRSSGG